MKIEIKHIANVIINVHVFCQYHGHKVYTDDTLLYLFNNGRWVSRKTLAECRTWIDEYNHQLGL